MNNNKVIVALDTNNLSKTIKLVKILKNHVHSFKIGHEFFFNFGIIGYKKIYKICPNIFLDLKLHDIPNTVKKGMKAISKLNPRFATIHISGGDEMMKSSLIDKKSTKILGVTVLTSLNAKQLKKFYNQNNLKMFVKKYSKFAKKNKLDGIICSPKEISYVRQEVGDNFIIVTPGIRLENKINKDDQKRVATPRKAIDLGANYLVIGRPITESKDPLKVLKKINKSLTI